MSFISRLATLVALVCTFATQNSSAFTTSLPRQSFQTSRKYGGSSSLSMMAASPSDGGVVITGAAGGVGYAYATEFVKRGYDVVICDVQDCTQAVRALNSIPDATGTAYGIKCDVGDAAAVQKLAQFAQQNLGTVKYWINNAGVNGGRRALKDVPISQVELVVRVNMLGTLLCTKAAMDVMANQPGVTGHIFNTVGSGVKGGGTPGYATYGATKRGLPQLTASLVKELEEGVQGYEKEQMAGSIQVHSLSPGMVFTKLLLDNSTPELRKFPFGVLAAQPEEVAQDLVPKILAINENGGSVEFLTTDRILTKFFERFVLQKKSQYIDDDGNVIRMPGEEYDELGVRKLYTGQSASVEEQAVESKKKPAFEFKLW